MLRHPLVVMSCLVLAVGWGTSASAETRRQAMPETMSMLGRVIAMPTVVPQAGPAVAGAQATRTQDQGQVAAMARYLADKLESAGFAKSDIEIIPVADTAALVVHYRGSGSAKPILISGHMDVVAADAKSWGRDPFKLTEKDGYLYGRGVYDMKTNDVALVETFMRLKREGFVPSHEMILVFSGDEETDGTSTEVLAQRYHHAEFLLNGDDPGSGGILTAQGKPILYEIQVGEKTYADFQLTATAPGGHSSEPNPRVNAIDRLAKALNHITDYQFPVRYNEVTLASLKASGEHSNGPLAQAMRQFAAHPGDAKAAATISADPAYVGQIRTTCIATMIDGGHARNALPSHAAANINCRIFPGDSVAAVEATLARVIADPDIKVAGELPTPVASPMSPLRPDVMAAVAATIHARYPGLPVVPVVSAAASDSMHFRIHGVPSYEVSPIFVKPDDSHPHGVNERILATEVPASLDFWHGLLSRLAK